MPTMIPPSPVPLAESASGPAVANSRNPALRGPVLLATDGASQSSAAPVTARRIADKLGVALEVVTVVEPQILYGTALGACPCICPASTRPRRSDGWPTFVTTSSVTFQVARCRR